MRPPHPAAPPARAALRSSFEPLTDAVGHNPKGSAMSDLSSLTAAQLVAGYTTGDFSPVEATRAVIEQAEKVQPHVNAFVRIDGDDALAQARDSAERWRRGEPQGLLDGVPVTVKDILLLRGKPTLRGSWSSSTDGPWEEDAPSVARLREHGAVFVGKTTTPEFGWKGVTDSPRHGITRNPYDTSRTAGGSSGGGSVGIRSGVRQYCCEPSCMRTISGRLPV